MTPEQRASHYLFGRADFVPFSKDHAFVDPLKLDQRVSFNQLVMHFTSEDNCACGGGDASGHASGCPR